MFPIQTVWALLPMMAGVHAVHDILHDRFHHMTPTPSHFDRLGTVSAQRGDTSVLLDLKRRDRFDIAFGGQGPRATLSSVSVVSSSCLAPAEVCAPLSGATFILSLQSQVDMPSSQSTPAPSGSALLSSSQAAIASNAPALSSNKRGLAYNSAALTSPFAGKDIAWAYNWGADPDGTIVSGAEYVPMLWGQDSISAWDEKVMSAIAAGSKHVLSFNEPDLGSQANLDPARAAQLHIDNMNRLAGQVQIGSPAITNGNSQNPLTGINWLQQFFFECNKQCQVDFVAFHWYGDASNVKDFQSHVTDVIGVAQSVGVRKVWLTEFRASGSDADAEATFLTQATSFLDTATDVERYAYFMCADGILVDGGSIASPIGVAYIS